MQKPDNIEELRDQLLDAFAIVRDDPALVGQVKAMTAASANILGTVKAQLEYAHLRGEKPTIAFLERNLVRRVPEMSAAKERAALPPVPAKALPKPEVKRAEVPLVSPTSEEAIKVGKSLTGAFTALDLKSRIEGNAQPGMWLGVWLEKGWVKTSNGMIYSRTPEFGKGASHV